MLSLDKCMGANRPLIFVVAESDLEVLQHLKDNYKDNNFFVYSTTLTNRVNLEELLSRRFALTALRASSTIEVLDAIHQRDFETTNNSFETYIFLDSDSYIHDKQNIRKIKDIMSRYQLDEHFTVNLIFISQFVSVPTGLERYGEVVFFNLPDDKELKERSEFLTKKLSLKKDQAPSDEVINNLKGLTKFEVEMAYLQSYHLYKRIDLGFIREFKKSAIAKTDFLSLLETDVSFTDIGGLDLLKNWIIKSQGGWTVEGKKFGLPLLKGLLLIGVPGTGKTLTAKAIGKEWGLPVINFDMSRVFSSRVGESEQNIRRILKIIEDVSPVIVFIDEMEKSMAGLDSSTFSDSGVTARLFGVFLTWMQENTKPVFIVGTANAIHYMPPELISRFDEVFFVNIPQYNERRDIFNIHLKRVKRNSEEFDIDLLARESKDLTGREIEQCIKESLYNVFYIKKDLSTEDILTVIRSKPGIKATMGEKIAGLMKWVGWDSDKQNGIRAKYASLPDNIDNIQQEIEDLINEVNKNQDSAGNGQA